MKQIVTLMAGAACGAVIGAAASLLLDQKTPEHFRQRLTDRWENAMSAAQEEMDRSEREMTAQFNALKNG